MTLTNFLVAQTVDSLPAVPWVVKIPWRRKWQPNPGFLSGKSQRQRSLAGYSPVHFSSSVLSRSLRPHGLKQSRPPCTSQTPRVYSNSCPLTWWCDTTNSSCVVPFSSCLQFFPASGSFQMSPFFTSGGQSIGASASTSVFPVNSHGWFPLGLTGLTSLLSKGISEFSPTL